ncbi:hypothetical protein X777_12402 [Ooceraea biroi]|uniref:Tim44-like domain-containing protein n=1 Tax=Ooceraea biroi TaxID=2015173 RepID=A0A026VZS2_OOCBI|nr:hypothetical protein X777_12402 [Ooceraea biroi]
MQVTMLVPTFRKIVPFSLRRMAASVSYRNGTKIAQHYNEPDLVSTTVQKIAACRLYCTRSDSPPRVSLPMLMDGPSQIAPRFFTIFKLFYLAVFKIIPHIDKEFNAPEFVKGATHATTLISKALMNEDYESLNGLVTEDVIEALRMKIETLSPNQRQLIAVKENNMMLYAINDINVTTDKTGDEHSIEISIICHYFPDLDVKQKPMNMSMSELQKDITYVVCHYTFVRKYVNNVGGPWIVTFVNHYSVI